jgi:hypothetical protein
MSDATAMSLLVGIFFVGFFGAYYSTKVANDRMDEILVGIVRGMAVSTKHRKLMLYNQWMPMISVLAGVSVISAFIFLQIGNATSTQGVRYVAYVLTGFASWSGLMYVVLGTSTMLQCFSILREAEAD